MCASLHACHLGQGSAPLPFSACSTKKRTNWWLMARPTSLAYGSQLCRCHSQLEEKVIWVCLCHKIERRRALAECQWQTLGKKSFTSESMRTNEELMWSFSRGTFFFLISSWFQQNKPTRWYKLAFVRVATGHHIVSFSSGSAAKLVPKQSGEKP